MPLDTVGKNLEKKILESSKGNVNISQHLRQDPTYGYPYQRTQKSPVAIVCQSSQKVLIKKKKYLWKKQTREHLSIMCCGLHFKEN